MKQFFKMVLASMLGIILSFIVISLLLGIIIAGIIASASDEKVAVAKNSVIHMSFDYPIVERGAKSPLGDLDLGAISGKKSIGLNDILASIKRAKTDDHIKGIYLDVSSLNAGMATIEEIRNALTDFKSSHKFILAYGEVYSKTSYYLASVADRIYINPEGILEFTGFNSELAFFKGALDKLEIEPQVIKVGTYKSAVEPFILDKMSPANREQITSFLGSLYDHYLQGISVRRKIPKDSVFVIANHLRIQNASDELK